MKAQTAARTFFFCIGCVLLFVSIVGEDGTTVSEKEEKVCEGCTGVFKCNSAVIMVVDGLRYTAARRMRYLMSEGKVTMSLARPPTVTLPRVKSIMSGRVGVFSDLLFNFFGGETGSEPNLLRTLHRHNFTITAHGDDTWHRTYPKYLTPHSDPVTSFFVSDYTIVDDNVTRHILPELRKDDNDTLLILHYLGVDHIGHYLGPYADEMAAKEMQMDNMVRLIHENLPAKTCMVVVSDHGMTKSGNHGGSSTDEIETVAAWLPSKEQGRVKVEIEDAGNTRNPSTIQQTDIAVTLALLMGVPVPSSAEGLLYPSLFTNETYERCLQCVAAHHSQDESSSFSSLDRSTTPATETSVNFPLLMIAMACVVPWIVTLRPTLHLLPLGLSVFSSTFSEESHVLYHYAAVSCVMMVAVVGDRTWRLNLFFIAILLRVLNGWTQSGILAMDFPAEHPRILDFIMLQGWLPIVHTVLLAHTVTRTRNFAVKLILLVPLVRYADVAHETGVALRWVGIVVSLTFLVTRLERWRAMVSLLGCVVPIEDGIVVFICGLLQELLDKHIVDAYPILVLLISLAGQAATGRSISIGHLKFSPAYEAVTGYHPVPLLVLTLLIHYSGLLTLAVSHLSSPDVRRHFTSYLICTLGCSAVAVGVFRNHLFIWSVFTPKLLFTCMDAMFYSILTIGC
eukprot:TRINITY_DN24451_c0_g1_i1.p1 TRINITY_DN24451_c0_g1~~TRINITY_DN24451_c0_g1_i1.p1  ORF type:complete len:687 (+),score=98.04 TRINITY_DN24451_c0_g1_i1:26-2062(+)